MTKSQQQAKDFIMAAQVSGFSVVVVNPNVVRIIKDITPGDKSAFAECDMNYSSVLALAPLKGGSSWGSDGASIGGVVALQNGRFHMNKSGDGVRFMNALTAELKKG